MNADRLNSLTERVLGAVFEVANTLGAGFLEKIYERSLLAELRDRGIRAVGQASIRVMYKEKFVGEYFADILVEDVLVVELKCVERLANEHTAQCINLSACIRPVGLHSFRSLRSSGRGSSIDYSRRRTSAREIAGK